MDDAIIRKHGMRRARAHARAKPVIDYIAKQIDAYRFETGRPHGLPPIYGLADDCNRNGITAARGGPVSHNTITRALKLMELTSPVETFRE